MEVLVHFTVRSVVDKSTGHVFGAWPSHSFEEPQLHGKRDPDSRFQPKMSPVEVYRVNAPIGSTLEMADPEKAPWLILRVSPKQTLNAAEVLTLARTGERGFKLLPAKSADVAT